MSNQGKKVIVGLSGGVDSSVSCALLKEQGFEVEAIFMKNWTPKSAAEGLLTCPLKADEKDARLVASQLGIKLSVISFEEEYRKEVVDYLFKEYQEGRTPNPDVLCNSRIKFKVFLKKALELGADYVATGHYVRREGDQLLKGADHNKDQSYFLYQITKEQLQKSLFPVGGYKKPEVRKLAQKFGLATAAKKDSQGICFVGEVAMKELLKTRIKPKKGAIITTEGEKIGEHEGAWYYTIGQRKGIGIGGGIPYYVASKDLKNNKLIVARGDKDEALFNLELQAGEIHWICGNEPKFPLACQAKIRYRQADQDCEVVKSGDLLEVRFKEPQRAITPGQFIVFYQDQVCLGGAKIL
ncbi:MAG: tRNA 2-thiouridine(34) synthase MnmA [Candidatus Komeilibacteria bacterium CG10_big_fil_rev_8_21_14_0_10_41_13]|uniref:tRNA-specific 2-thiouridylase MnmA n=1 Tax=Candidatus Komeilibacteria bacterium CG10_big_fil_rev_8_21_14_0_10_41_13 TaxID=1974476 RepID=A0A2M6WD95_9BACT|nr:MAG: tRNA 2-thiouridine(34) synthase MnmA [Candidatus Komeilibacteria bacterium CG10_big_fil_rev_8_21_14_0_10_41_13]